MKIIRYLQNNNQNILSHFNPLSANPTKWSNTLKQFVGNLPTNCLSVFDHFMNLALKGLRMTESCKVGAVIIYLSKTFDSLNHKLLLGKLKAYGLDKNSVEFFNSS